MSSLFALIDCNSFYASCEKIFDPSIKNRPVVVLSNNDGCVVSSSKEVKCLNIPPGIPFFKIKKLVETHNIKVFSSNYALYGDISNRVMSIIASECPNIEVYSIDEAFVDLTGIDEEDAFELMREIQIKIKKWVGIEVTIGISKTRTLAKIACGQGKHLGTPVFHIAEKEDADAILAKISCGQIWGIGAKSSEKLYLSKIKSGLDLKNADETVVRKLLGINGVRKILELKGINGLENDSITLQRKSISSSKSFGEGVFNIEDISKAITYYATRCVAKLREQKSVCKYVTVFIQTGAFDELRYFNTRSFVFDSETDSNGKIVKAAVELLSSIYKDGFKYKKAGVILGELLSKDEVQLNLFSPVDSSDEKLNKVLDKIKLKMGKDSVNYGVVKESSPWNSKEEYKSKNYTTVWSDLKRVK